MPRGRSRSRSRLDEDHIQQLVDERQQARKHRDFGLSDKLRDDLVAMGVRVDDNALTWFGPDGLTGSINKELPGGKSRGGGDASQNGGGGGDGINDALRMIDQACHDFPEGTLDVEYTITCEMPKDKVSFMIGKSGAYVKDVRKTTKTQIHFDKEGDRPESETQTLVITGRLIDAYRAHAMMMKRYHADADVGGKPEPSQPDVEDLKRQMEQLKKQLDAVTGSSGGGTGSAAPGRSKDKGKGKGKGKRK